jgi:hypothetical protein
MTATPDEDAALERELARLREDYETLKEQKVRTEQDLANVERQLAELERQAEAEYGSSDPERLQALLEEQRAKNRALVADYAAHIAGIRQDLTALEDADQEPEA